MKRSWPKVIAISVMFIAISNTSAVAADTISSAWYNDIKISIMGENLPLTESLVSVVSGGVAYARTYMPLRSLLESLGFKVNWDSQKNEIDLIPTIIERDGLIIRNCYIPVGYQYFNIDLEENLGTGCKWQCTIPEDSKIVLTTDKYLSKDEGSTDISAVHRFTVSIPKDLTPDNTILIISFEQILDGKKTGYTINYYLESLPSGGLQ